VVGGGGCAHPLTWHPSYFSFFLYHSPPLSTLSLLAPTAGWVSLVLVSFVACSGEEIRCVNMFGRV